MLRSLRNLAPASLALLFIAPLSTSAARLGEDPVPVQSVGKAYVSNTDDGTISVIDLATQTVLTTIDLNFEDEPVEPRGSALTPDGSRLYVCDSGSDRVVVINTATDSVIDEIPVSTGQPWDICITPNGTKAYVSLREAIPDFGGTGDGTPSFGSHVSVIGTTTNDELGLVNLSGASIEPEGICASPDGSRVYVVANGNGSIFAISTVTDEVVGSNGEIPAGPHACKTSADGTRIIVVGESQPAILNAATMDVIDDKFFDYGQQTDVDVAGSIAYVTTNSKGSGIVAYDLAIPAEIGGQEVNTFLVMAIAICPGTSEAWFTGDDDGDSELRAFDFSEGPAPFTSTGDGGGFVGDLGFGINVGDDPTAITILANTGQTVVPRFVRLALHGVNRDVVRLLADVNDAGSTLNLTLPVTIRIGDLVRNVTLTPNANQTHWRFKNLTTTIDFQPKRFGSSHGILKMIVKRSTLTSLIPLDGPCAVSITTAGIPTTTAVVDLQAGAFRFGRSPGLLTNTGLSVVSAKVIGSHLKAQMAFDTDGDVPTSLGTVNVTFAGFSTSVPGSSFTRVGSTYVFHSASFDMSIDFLRAKIVVEAHGAAFGPLADPIAVTANIGDGEGTRTTVIELGAQGGAMVF